jgi:diguanylate cyclase (GGDEF)-like protein
MIYSRAIEPSATEALLVELDQALEEHVAWNQRIMRCAVLRESPGDDVLEPDADRRCVLGRWLLGRRDERAALDAALIDELVGAHREMHGAVRSMCTCLLAGQPAAPDDLERYERTQRVVVGLLHRAREHVLRAGVHLDELTGLPLRHGLAAAFRIRQADALRAGANLYLAMIDADHFKRVNDRFGHLVGDAVLRHLAKVLTSAVRSSDVVYRFGGEEFLALVVSRVSDGGELAATRMLEAVRAATPPAPVTGVTVTIGVAAALPGETLEDVTERADRALLEGKRRGRDRVVVAGR